MCVPAQPLERSVAEHTTLVFGPSVDQRSSARELRTAGTTTDVTSAPATAPHRTTVIGLVSRIDGSPSEGAVLGVAAPPRAALADPAGIEQEIYALLSDYQALRLAMADALLGHEVTPDRAGFTIAMNAAP